jgi:hypothetical protein
MACQLNPTSPMLQILHDGMKSFEEEPENEISQVVPQLSPKSSQKEFLRRCRFNMQIFKGLDH